MELVDRAIVIIREFAGSLEADSLASADALLSGSRVMGMRPTADLA